jgi:3-hydroxyisobutyrate dehydrogenase
MRVGVIGTGTMGSPIAANCLAAGHSVIVYNRTRARADELRAFGAVAADAFEIVLADRSHLGAASIGCEPMRKQVEA